MTGNASKEAPMWFRKMVGFTMFGTLGVLSLTVGGLLWTPTMYAAAALLILIEPDFHSGWGAWAVILAMGFAACGL